MRGNLKNSRLKDKNSTLYEEPPLRLKQIEHLESIETDNIHTVSKLKLEAQSVHRLIRNLKDNSLSKDILFESDLLSNEKEYKTGRYASHEKEGVFRSRKKEKKAENRASLL